VTYDHPLEKRALERTLGIILFQDQVNQLAIDVAGFNPSQADQLRRPSAAATTMSSSNSSISSSWTAPAAGVR